MPVSISKVMLGGMLLCSALNNWNDNELLASDIGTVECGNVGRKMMSFREWYAGWSRNAVGVLG